MTRRRNMTLLAAVAASVAAPAAGASLLKDVAFETVAQGDGMSSSLTRADDRVVRTAPQWQQVWSQLNAGIYPPSPPPKVDFKRSMLLVVLMGQRGSGGHSVAVTQVSKTARFIRVQVDDTSPGDRCSTTTVMTAPYHVAKVPRSNRAVLFKHRQTTYDCGS